MFKKQSPSGGGYSTATNYFNIMFHVKQKGGTKVNIKITKLFSDFYAKTDCDLNLLVELHHKVEEVLHDEYMRGYHDACSDVAHLLEEDLNNASISSI